MEINHLERCRADGLVFHTVTDFQIEGPLKKTDSLFPRNHQLLIANKYIKGHRAGQEAQGGVDWGDIGGRKVDMIRLHCTKFLKNKDIS